MPTHYVGNETETRALDAFIKLMRCTESVTARLYRQLEASALTISQFGALEALYHLGPMCQQAIAGKLLKSGGNITVVVDNLEQRGLVARRRSTTDRRMLIVTLTGPGEKLIQEVFPKHLDAIVEEMNILAPDEQETLGRLCKMLGLRSRQPADSERGR